MDEMCADCTAEVDHCHGTLVRHRGLLVECSDQGCHSEDRARHLWVLDCELIDGSCGCGQSTAVELRLVS